jgi:hypothetical protein
MKRKRRSERPEGTPGLECCGRTQLWILGDIGPQRTPEGKCGQHVMEIREMAGDA